MSKVKIRINPSSDRFVLFCWNMGEKCGGTQRKFPAKAACENESRFPGDVLSCASRMVTKLH